VVGCGGHVCGRVAVVDLNVVGLGVCKRVEVEVRGQTLVDVTEGRLHVDIRVMGVTVESQVLDVCTVVRCPLSKGEEYVGVVTQEIPAGTPAHIGATVRISLVTSASAAPLSCLESYVEIGGTGDLSVMENDFGLTRTEVMFLFDQWKRQYPKAVANLETFAGNVIKIFTHNIKQDKTFIMALNEFGSMTQEEFVRTRMGLRQPKRSALRGPEPDHVTFVADVSKADPPSEIDWTTRGVVAPVKNQGSCGSCWAFSAIGSLESAYAMKTGTLVEFSEQELVSCDDNDYGCQGGLMDTAFDWIEHSSAGLCTEADYVYTSGSTSARGECLRASCNAVPDSVPKAYVDVPPSEAALLAAISEHGPVSVAIEADQSVFQFYHRGVLTGSCGTHLNHGVLLVGYGIDAETGTPFWKVKNSWGTGWGEEGFVRMLRGKRWPAGGECGIATKASYPVFE